MNVENNDDDSNKPETLFHSQSDRRCLKSAATCLSCSRTSPIKVGANSRSPLL
ncbi:MAG: hypothetical protein PUP91_30430 [Rhizonema sp. PD37]|nr:hypothetical protein [Rhizonema sp. PD37]